MSKFFIIVLLSGVMQSWEAFGCLMLIGYAPGNPGNK